MHDVAKRRLLLVHAHPDDETLFTGGVMARYAAEGAHVCLVTCTNGELGEIAANIDGEDPELLRPRLGEVRLHELELACSLLGVTDVRPLGYRDSGMAGTPANRHPQAFINIPLSEAAARVAHIVDETRPHVVVTYDEHGFYGHPDHIRAHQVAIRAIQLAAPRWQVQRVYHTAVSRSAMLELSGRHGTDDKAAQRTIWTQTTPDEVITTAVDVLAHLDRKVAAIRAHRTQLGTTASLLEAPPDVQRRVLGTEHFVLAGAPVPERLDEDLFGGVEP